MPPPYCYDYPRPSVTVDLVLFALDGEELRVLLIRRGRDPFAGSWALPGGFLDIEEPPEDGARRELREETGIDLAGAPLAPLGAFADPGRDPRGRTISLPFASVLPGGPSQVKGGDDASEAGWRLARDDAPLAFDHDAILASALDWLVEAVRLGPTGMALLPEEFNESEVRALHRAIFGTHRGAAAWLKRMEKLTLVEPREGSARLYHALTTGGSRAFGKKPT